MPSALHEHRLTHLDRMTNASLKNKKRDTLLAVLDQADDFLLQEKRNIEKINKKCIVNT